MSEDNYIDVYLKQRLRNRVVMSIVIPTRELVTDLNKDLERIEFIQPNIDSIFDFLMGTLYFKSNAPWMLDKESKRFAKVLESIQPTHSDEVRISIFNIGNRLFQLLDNHNAYESDILIYQKHKWVGLDLVLRKLTKDELPEIN